MPRVLRELSKMEQRYDAVLAVMRDGMTVTQVAEKYGVGRQTVHVWLARYEAGGLEGLADRSHRPRSSPLQMAAETEARVLELRRMRPYWGPASIRHQLGRDGVEAVPSLSGIYRALCATGSWRAAHGARCCPTTGAGSAAGRWSSGRRRRRRGVDPRRHGGKGAHRHRRPLPLLCVLRGHGKGDRPAGVRLVRRRPRAPRRAGGGADRHSSCVVLVSARWPAGGVRLRGDRRLSVVVAVRSERFIRLLAC